MTLILSSGKRDFSLDPPWTNAAGTLGFSDEAKRRIDFSLFGAFITHPISYRPRHPANFPRLHAFLGGFLLHTGHPNPGFRETLRRHRRRWGRFPCPVVVHLLGQDPEQLSWMVSQLEEVEGITGVEIGLGEQSLEESRQLILAASAGELPIIANLPLGQTSSLIRAMVDAGACAISLGPPRGTWRGPESELIHGRLYGPGLFPLALRAVYALRSQIECPLIVTGGVSTQQELRTMLQAGASAVQLDSVLWTKPERVLTSPVE